MEKFEKELLSELHGINKSLESITRCLINYTVENDKHFMHMEKDLHNIATDNRTAMEAKAKTWDTITSIIVENKDTLDKFFAMVNDTVSDVGESEEPSEEVVLRSADELLHSEYISPIEDLGFKIRTFNCVHRTGINTLGDLCSCTRDELLKRISAKMVDGEIIPVLIDHGYKLKTSEEQETETNYKETEEE